MTLIIALQLYFMLIHLFCSERRILKYLGCGPPSIPSPPSQVTTSKEKGKYY